MTSTFNYCATHVSKYGGVFYWNNLIMFCTHIATCSS